MAGIHGFDAKGLWMLSFEQLQNLLFINFKSPSRSIHTLFVKCVTCSCKRVFSNVISN